MFSHLILNKSKDLNEHWRNLINNIKAHKIMINEIKLMLYLDIQRNITQNEQWINDIRLEFESIYF
jgi:hypothetical protein